ncbi:hypothetical protein LguiA_036723 [Lonicera macranthoides]
MLLDGLCHIEKLLGFMLGYVTAVVKTSNLYSLSDLERNSVNVALDDKESRGFVFSNQVKEESERTPYEKLQNYRKLPELKTVETPENL